MSLLLARIQNGMSAGAPIWILDEADLRVDDVMGEQMAELPCAVARSCSCPPVLLPAPAAAHMPGTAEPSCWSTVLGTAPGAGNASSRCLGAAGTMPTDRPLPESANAST